MIRTPKRLTLQFVLVKPVLCLVEIILIGSGVREQWGWWLLMNGIYNITYTASLIGLYLIYFASRNHSALAGKHSSRTAASSVPAHLGRWLKTRCVLFGSRIDGLSGGWVSHPPSHE